MKKILKYFFLLFSTSVTAQNLVPNPSFEDTVACPTTVGQINLATGWVNCGITPDYFNPCNTVGLGTPINAFGHQMPLHGNAYAGLGLYVSTVSNIREFIGRQLSQTLIIGQNYFVSFYVSLADTAYYDCAINKIGMKFSTAPYSSSAPPPLTNSAYVYTNSIISNENNWTKISGWYMADSAYNFIVVGNFFDDANTDTANCTSTAYYFLDMVCVSTDSTDCSLEIIKHIPDAYSNGNILKIFPQPSSETLNIHSASTEIEGVEIYSIMGDLIYSKSFGRINNVIVPLTNIANGIYLIKIVANKNCSIHKVQIIH